MFGDIKDSTHSSGFAMITLVSIALTIPFICYAKDIAASLRVIAGRKSVP